jgi:hypothetical protein
MLSMRICNYGFLMFQIQNLLVAISVLLSEFFTTGPDPRYRRTTECGYGTSRSRRQIKYSDNHISNFCICLKRQF